MRKLDRNAVPVPECLIAPDAERRYAHLTGREKQSIRAALLVVQSQRCAYCERRTGTEPNDGHIEHFRNQANNQHLDLTWENMFWSCNDESTCGKSKDNCVRAGGVKAAFECDQLIDPCLDDPDDYLLFVTDGTIQIRENLSIDETGRASETLRVFHLAESAFLRKSREDAVKPYVNAIDALLPFGVEVVQQYVGRESAVIDKAPFSAAICQFFRSYSP
jgi:uncharacterized protein (TIGR02646 family)